MKVRAGFVSNSSSSSFCIWGTFLEEDKIETPELLQFILEHDKEFKTLEDVKKCAEADGRSELLYALETPLGLEYHRIDGDYGYYIGDSWSSIGDDETGRQFKDKVEAKIKKLWPDAKFSTHEEAWENG